MILVTARKDTDGRIYGRQVVFKSLRLTIAEAGLRSFWERGLQNQF